MSKLKTLNSNSSTKSKRVHFDSKDHVLVYDDTRDQSNELFYSEKEYDAMRNANKGVIEDVANQLFLSPSVPSSVSIAVDGIYSLIDRKSPSRKKCVRAVLEVQAMQELLQVYDEVKIASASRQHSMESQSRAHLTGLLQSCWVFECECYY